jgi:APA family basic amino acid/polyamine antiporter
LGYKVFVRDATGLVRALSPIDNFMLGIVGITPGVALVLYNVYLPYLYPGVNMTLGTLGSIPVSLIFGATYYLLSISMPRSGGDYVYGSRIIHPLWGLLPNWMYTFVNVSALGFYASTVGGSYLGVFFAMLGSFYNNSQLLSWAAAVSSINGAFIVAIVVIWASAVINVLGIRAYAKAQVGMFVIAMLGIIVLLIVLASNSNQSFQAAFNHYGTNYNATYTGIIAQAKSSGWSPQNFSVTQTMLALPYIAGFSLATVWPVIPAGEAKSPQKSMLYGTIYAIAVAGVIYLVTTILFYNVVGDEFTKAIGYISNCGCTTYPLPVGPYIQYLTSMLTDNPALVFFLGFSFLVWSVILLPAFYIITTRSMFAWSFDRLLPSFLADVNDTFHAPMKAILVVAVLASVAAALSLYTTYVGYAFNLTLAVVSSFVFAGVAAAVFPYSKRARHIYEQAPPIVRKKIGGVPMITIIGAAEAIIFGYLTFLDGTSPALSGPINPASLGLIAVMYIIPFVIYFGAKAYHKSRGLNLDLAFKEVPPE